MEILRPKGLLKSKNIYENQSMQRAVGNIKQNIEMVGNPDDMQVMHDAYAGFCRRSPMIFRGAFTF